MRDVFLLTRRQLGRIKPYSLVWHGVLRVDDLLVISGIIRGGPARSAMEGCA
ncbi:MAG: hypothetical protein AB7P24_01155 [Nitrospira sp.]